MQISGAMNTPSCVRNYLTAGCLMCTCSHGLRGVVNLKNMPCCLRAIFAIIYTLLSSFCSLYTWNTFASLELRLKRKREALLSLRLLHNNLTELKRILCYRDWISKNKNRTIEKRKRITDSIVSYFVLRVGNSREDRVPFNFTFSSSNK